MPLHRWFQTAAAAVLLLGAAQAEAQITQPLDVRLDLVGAEFDPFVVNVVLPGSAAAGLFLNERFAVEGSLGVVADDEDWILITGVSFPFYMASDYGRSGLFVAPVLEAVKIKDVDALFDYGVDVGMKMPLSPRTSWRLAATVRDGDSYESVSFGVMAGLSLLFR
jgi:hypothetical protein